jgi:hypothetical protein
MLISGLGVAKGSGGSEASQVALACSMAAKLESRSAEPHIWLSRAASDEAGSRSSGLLATARQLAATKTTRSNEHILQTVITNSKSMAR